MIVAASAPVRYGIVGAGYFGREFARIIERMPGATLAAVYSPGDGHELADEFGCANVDSVDELVKNIDAIIVASPNHAHREPVLAAAARGVHVFCEKPVALDFSDCDAMVSACEQAGVLFLAGHVMHFMPGIREVARLIDAGAIGELVVARAVRTGWEDGSSAPGWKKTRALSGGHLYHHIHELDVIQHLMGAADSATMIGGAVPQAGDRIGDEDAILLATLTFPGHKFASLEWGSVFRRPEHSVTIQGTLGYIEIDFHNVGVTLHVGERTEKFLLHRSAEEDAERVLDYASAKSGGGVTYGDSQRRPPLWLRGGMEKELDYFNGLIDGSIEVDPQLVALTNGTAARASIATADALTRSMGERRTAFLRDDFSLSFR
ncbi:MAG: Gfo/Idh/MocA family protein [Rhodoglobus sp.]